MKYWGYPAANAGHFQMPRFVGINYGTDKYPPKVARRQRAVNITNWCASGAGSLLARPGQGAASARPARSDLRLVH
jgi:hypothetical protein